MHLISAYLVGAIYRTKYSDDNDAFQLVRDTPEFAYRGVLGMSGPDEDRHAAFTQTAAYRSDAATATKVPTTPAPTTAAKATTAATPAATDLVTPTGSKVAPSAATAATDSKAKAGATAQGGAATGGPGDPADAKDGKTGTWDYWMTGTGLLLWLGPLVCIVLVGALAVGGKYYREQAKKQARLQQHHSVVQPSKFTAIAETHRKTVLTKQQTAALEDRDVVGLCDLLGDQTPLEGEQAEPHPWAKAPQTVGALAGMHIASLAAEDPYGCAAEVHACGGLAKFVGFLNESEDRQHCALITLALLAYNDVCAAALVEEQVAEKLVRYRAVGPYQSTTVAIILRYVFFYSEATKSSFVQQHGLTLFTDLLAETQPEIQLTAVTNILDILFGAGGLDSEILSCLQAEPLKSKVAAHLKPMMDATDDDVKENAAYLHETIVGAA